MRWLLPLILLLTLALRMSGWYTDDIKEPWQTFEPDETQHIRVARLRFDTVTAPPHNTVAFGNLLAYAHVLKAGDETDFGAMTLTGRQLSTVFALLLVITVFTLGRATGLSPPFAACAGFLLAGCDVNATYSHYAIPAMGYVYSIYLAVLGSWRVSKNQRFGVLLLGLGIAGSLSLKFDFIPLVLLLSCALAQRRFYALGTALASLLLGLSLLNLGWSPTVLWETFRFLSSVNFDVVAQDDHWRDNLIVYPFGVLAGIGLPAFLLSIKGLFFLRARRGNGTGSANIRYWLLLVIVLFSGEFIVRYAIDTAFIRRVNIFMPAVCLLAAYALQRLRAGVALRSAVVIYTFALALIGQSNHWFDTRYAARDFVNELPADIRVSTSSYFGVNGLRKVGYVTDGGWDYAVLTEPHFARYYRSMTTPFGVPECCEEVYNCAKEEQCALFQDLLLNEEPVAVFRPLDVFPERLAYRYFFGYYESFLGEVRVYRNPQAEALRAD